jgi:2-polyprenyl-6-methoxyphenol hydroxylase-like FAD-dependent oxidoreductase
MSCCGSLWPGATRIGERSKMREERTDVLVVGAGPVGLMTALLLAEAGIEVRIIDREERTTARSYACALHPRTLELLAQLGMADEIIRHGNRVETVGFYEGSTRRAEIALSKLPTEFPFLLILPQSRFESALEQRLRQKAGIQVDWRHRFDALEIEDGEVAAAVEKLGGTSTGYIVPHWETVVQDRFRMRARYLVGADGAKSLVRQRLGIENTRVGGPDFFAAYEFESDTPSPNEVRVVMDQATTNVLWPLSNQKYRWTFQLVKSEVANEWPEKERRAVRVAHSTVDDAIRRYVDRVAKQRAPWFQAGVKEVTWCTDVVFEHRLANEFGRGRCVLMGDAAHQTGPVGAQSMNVGFQEARELSGIVKSLLVENANPELLDDFRKRWHQEWQLLLGMGGGLASAVAAGNWSAERRSRLLSCLPSFGDHLGALARQLGLAFSPAREGKATPK